MGTGVKSVSSLGDAFGADGSIERALGYDPLDSLRCADTEGF